MQSRVSAVSGFILLVCLTVPIVTAYSADSETVYINPMQGIRDPSGVPGGNDTGQPVNVTYRQYWTEPAEQITQNTIPAGDRGVSIAAPPAVTGEMVSAVPAPYFPTRSVTIRTSYSPTGLIVSSSVGKVVMNGGGAGNVFYNISGSGISPKTKTFRMASGESLRVWAEVCHMTYFCPFGLYQMSVRPSRSGDTDAGTFVIEQTRKDQVGVFRPSNHRFFLKNGTVNTTITWGQTTDIPVSGDWNNDGLWDVGVFHNATRVFILKNGTRNTTVSWGSATDLPVTGDWNRDGFTDVGVFRPVNHKFYLRNGSIPLSYSWGISTDLPVTGDWNGDGLWDVGVYRQSLHTFCLRNGSANTSVSWGISTDLPVTGDWNGDGLWDVGVFRNATHRFYLRNGTANTSVNWGLGGDKPVSGKWS